MRGGNSVNPPAWVLGSATRITATTGQGAIRSIRVELRVNVSAAAAS